MAKKLSAISADHLREEFSEAGVNHVVTEILIRLLAPLREKPAALKEASAALLIRLSGSGMDGVPLDYRMNLAERLQRRAVGWQGRRDVEETHKEGMTLVTTVAGIAAVAVSTIMAAVAAGGLGYVVFACRSREKALAQTVENVDKVIANLRE